MAITVIVSTTAFDVIAQHGPANEAELSVKKLQVAPGLKVELFAAEPLVQNPVAFSIDERGRFFIAESHRWKDSIFDVTKETNWLLGDLSFRNVEDRAAFLQKQFATNLNILTKDSELVRLVEDRDGDGRAETSSIFATGFNQTVSGVAAGILARKGEVWFTCIPDLWKISQPPVAASRESASINSKTEKSPALLRGTATKRELLSTGFGVHIGVSGHDLHGLVMGPDGKIYFSSGDRGFSVRTKEGKLLDYPDTGGVLRCNPDGSDLEVFATGLRNPQELAFDQYGNLFTDDNDTAGEDHSRLIYVVEGGDYGWRASYQFMEGFGPWVRENNWRGNIDGTLPHSGEVAQGPAGLAFYPGTGLPEKYQNHFLACDFPKGVWSFAVKPKGASYEVTDKEKFLWNLGPTDVDFGPDGSAYACDWGTSYSMTDSGRIYRIFDPAQKENPALGNLKKLLAEGMKKRSVKELATLLGHPDLRVRMEAQFEFENRPPKNLSLFGKTHIMEMVGGTATTLLQIANYGTNQLARIHAMRALGGISRKADNSLSDLLAPSAKDSDPEIRAQVAKQLGSSGKTDSAFDALILLLKDSSSRVRFFAASGLARFKWIGKEKRNYAVRQIFDFLNRNADEDAYLVHAGVWALVNIGEFDAIQSGAKDENPSVRRAALLAMRRMQRVEIAQFLTDADPKLVLEAARAINDVPINDAMPQLAALLGLKISSLKTNEFAQVMRRAINANFRLGQNSNAVALASFSSSATAPEAMRAEALDALSDWENPSPLDRVMGLWRPLTNRKIAVAQNAFHSVGNELFKSESEAVMIAAVRCTRKLKLNEPVLFPLFKATQSTALRVEILQTLAKFKADSLPEAVELALADSHSELRREGIKSTALLAPDQAPVLLERVLAAETDFRIKQTAFATLGKLTNAAATEVLNRQLDLLLAGKISPELQLDLLDAAEKKPDWRLSVKIVDFKAKFLKEDSLADFRVALVGGDAERGKKIFYEREDVACLRCHAISGQGGNVGPDLKDIAAKKSREYLLESVVYPNRQIATGFENIVVTTKTGNSFAGMVKSDEATDLVLNSPEDGIVKIAKADIQKRERGISPMPEGMDKALTRFELRDLIEFLAGLQ